MTIKAQCCCGACSVEIEGEPLLNAICHCTNCKRRTGSAFGWSVYVADRQVVRRDGDFGVYDLTPTRPQRRWFCTGCGTTLCWQVAWRPHQTGIAGGCFAGQALAPPSVTVSNDGRCAWLGLPPHWRTSV